MSGEGVDPADGRLVEIRDRLREIARSLPGQDSESEAVELAEEGARLVEEAAELAVRSIDSLGQGD